MKQVKLIKVNNDNQLVKYVVDVNNILDKYWCNIGIITTIEELNKLESNKRILANNYIDINDISFGNKDYSFILTNKNANVYFTKVKDNTYKVDIDIYSFKDCLFYVDINLNKLQFSFQLDFGNL